MAALPPPPPGFVLQPSGGTGGAVPPPPPGFVLDGAAQPTSQAPAVSQGESLARGAEQGATLGFGDEIRGQQEYATKRTEGAQVYGRGGGVHLNPKNYKPSVQAGEKVKNENRAANAAASAANPWTYGGGELAGAVASGAVLPALAPIRGAGIAATAGNAALEGAAIGAAQGAGTATEGNRVAGAAKGAAVGGLAGGALGAGAGALASRGAAKAASKAAPATADIKAASQAAYKAADSAGLVVTPQSTQRLAAEVQDVIKEAGFHPKIHNKTAGAVESIVEAAGKPATLQDLDNLRQIASQAAASIEPTERRMATQVIKKVDKYLTTLGPQDVAAGDVNKAVNALKSAQKDWHTYSKSETIDRLVQSAMDKAPTLTNGGVDTALRNTFKAFVNNPKKLRGFTASEVAALRDIARGNITRNTLRRLGTFAPTGIMSAVLGQAAGSLLPGVGGIAVPILGFGAKAAATASTKGAVERASTLVRSAAAPAQGISRSQAKSLTPLLRTGSRAAALAAAGLTGDHPRLPAR